MQTCHLSKYYVDPENPDDARAAEELNCTEANGAQARDCAKLQDQCRLELIRRRDAPGSTGR